MSDTRDLLFPYQLSAVDAALSRLDSPGLDLIVVPTGGGKTWIISAIAEMTGTRRVLIATPRIRLLEQTCKTLRVDFGVLSSNLGHDIGDKHRVIVGTVQTLMARELEPPDVIVIDECHFGDEKCGYGGWLELYPNAKVFGLTGTPLRDNEHLSELGWTTIYEIGILELIRDGRLVPPRSLSTVSTNVFTGPENRENLTRAIIPNLVKAAKDHDCRKILIFASDIDHLTFIEAHLHQSGERAIFTVHSELAAKKTSNAFRQFEAHNDRAWLVNVGLVTMGVDIPSIDAVALLRNVASFALLAQMIGRGLRAYPGKKECKVFDFGDGTSTFGFIDKPTLKARSRVNKYGSISLKTCPQCFSLNYTLAKICSYCGHTFLFRTHLQTNSQETQLLSAKIRVLTIAEAALSFEKGRWKIEYRFIEEPSLRAYEFYKTKPKPKNGRVLAERLQSNNCVEIRALS